MVKAMRDKGLPVTYVVYTDEGHGFARPDNRLDFYGRVDEFLGQAARRPRRAVAGDQGDVGGSALSSSRRGTPSGGAAAPPVVCTPARALTSGWESRWEEVTPT